MAVLHEVGGRCRAATEVKGHGVKDTQPDQPVIEAKGLNLVFQTADGPVQALKDVNLTINQGDFVSFIGPSGCGKTTFLRAIAALEHPTGGTLTVNGMTPDEARQEAGLWLCVPGGGVVSLADDCREHPVTA